MRLNRKLGVILLSAAALAGACIFTQAQSPIGDKWWPSRWGAEDQRGAANLMTPERASECGSSHPEGPGLPARPNL